ncbi:MAG: plasma-membrane proton-efflux P-type ATPase [Pseudomonadota bacterium]
MPDANTNSQANLIVEEAENVALDEVFQQLESSTEGLSATEAAQRLARFGPNELSEEKESALRKLLAYFWGPLPWMLEAAAILSLLVQHWTDFGIILFMLLFNAGIGFWEEHKASNALAALKSGLALKARAYRDAAWAELAAVDLVPGDMVQIKLGDVVPADCKLVDGDYLSIDQAALTGESLPVSKKSGDLAYSGSIAKKGAMTGVVVATGGNTFFGKTAKLVAKAGAVSHFQQAVMAIGNFLIFVSLGLSVVLIAVELYRDLVLAPSWHWDDVLDILQFVLILVIASIPVAMPAVLSVTMALGALALSKKKAIVSRLQAIEELAGVDVLCSDKTGTLTKNQLTVDTPIPLGDVPPERVLLVGALASQQDVDDAIDTAVIAALPDTSQLDRYSQSAFTPFDPVSKRTESVVSGPEGELRCTKGAPQVVAELCALEGSDAAQAEQAVAELASKGFRALSVAESQDNGNTWTFLGVLPMYDPPRDDSKQTIAEAKAYGLSVKMITGDDVAIGNQIAGQLGMGRHLIAASDVFAKDVDVSHLPASVEQVVEDADGFGRVFPEHKYAIVKSLQDRGHLVAMTGDGVNDAPALKQADCGVAVSGATDAARAAAALILTAPGLSVIISAIEEARQIFLRMMSYTIYRIAMTIDIMVFVVLSMLIFDFRPLTAVMIILLALLDDIPIMTIAYDRTPVQHTPARWRMGRVLTISSVLGVIAVAQTFGLLLMGLGHVEGQFSWLPSIDNDQLQTALFLQLVVSGHLLLFVTRSEHHMLAKPLPSPILFSALMGTQVIALLIACYGIFMTTLPWAWAAFIWVYNLIFMLFQDVVKIGAYRLMDSKTRHHMHFLRRANTKASA